MFKPRLVSESCEGWLAFSILEPWIPTAIPCHVPPDIGGKKYVVGTFRYNVTFLGFWKVARRNSAKWSWQIGNSLFTRILQEPTVNTAKTSILWVCDVPSQTLLAASKRCKTSGISGQKVCFPWVSKDTPNFSAPHPFTWKTPIQPEDIRTKSLGLGSFSCLIEMLGGKQAQEPVVGHPKRSYHSFVLATPEDALFPTETCTFLQKMRLSQEAKIYTPILHEGVPRKHLEASLVYMYFHSFSPENKLFGIHQSSFLLFEELEFSELKTPLVYTFLYVRRPCN